MVGIGATVEAAALAMGMPWKPGGATVVGWGTPMALFHSAFEITPSWLASIWSKMSSPAPRCWTSGSCISISEAEADSLSAWSSRSREAPALARFFLDLRELFLPPKRPSPHSSAPSAASSARQRSAQTHHRLPPAPCSCATTSVPFVSLLAFLNSAAAPAGPSPGSGVVMSKAAGPGPSPSRTRTMAAEDSFFSAGELAAAGAGAAGAAGVGAAAGAAGAAAGAAPAAEMSQRTEPTWTVSWTLWCNFTTVPV
mmetsp:Transcript_7832/g.22156  ORF Transcript_7832/g.22156 Transcript_7832/m.22156 type:complete len:254 (+) Transcript_7832:162-923(+)